jgi:predicted RNase H-like HicB family nuclease
MEIQFTTNKEGRAFVAHTRELDLASYGCTQQKALQNLKEAVPLFLEEAEKMALWSRFSRRLGT